MTIKEHVVFRMPVDHEYQFAAMVVLQNVVNGYQKKVEQQDVTNGKAIYELSYDVQGMLQADWDFFIAAGLQLDKQPCMDSTVLDMLVDMSDARIESFKYSGKHVAQACGILAGTEVPVFPALRRITPRMGSHKWGVWQDHYADIDYVKYFPITVEDLVKAQDQDWTGTIGDAGRGTYLSAAMGIATVEIIPPQRPFTWISKWANSGYRVVDTPLLYQARVQVARAVASVEKGIADHALI